MVFLRNIRVDTLHKGDTEDDDDGDDDNDDDDDDDDNNNNNTINANISLSYTTSYILYSFVWLIPRLLNFCADVSEHSVPPS